MISKRPLFKRPFLTIIGSMAAIIGLAIGSTAAAQHAMPHDTAALSQDPRTAPGQIAPVLAGLGKHHHPVTTRSARAQMFFDQGLKLAYGFNHAEALRSFKEAARLDPDCAMAYWGWALVLGPNINMPMRPEVAGQAYEAIQSALARKDRVSPQERDYIDALATRYSADASSDRRALDTAYTEAMGRLHAKYPDDPDAATLYAESLMDLSPWNYWTKDGHPGAHTPIILSVLERVMAHNPDHTGSRHLYIHAVEAVDAERAMAAAEQLSRLTTGIGHLIHMPTHIYMQMGRYAESYRLNGLAAQADEAYITQCRDQGIYPLGYYPHNVRSFPILGGPDAG